MYKVGNDPAPHAPALSYVRKGISKINVTAVIKLVASLRVGGGDTPLDRIEGFLKFAAFLLGDVGHNCLNTTATAVNVEYFWSSDGTNGVLLGMVRRPDHLELRTVTYMPSAAPTMGSKPLAMARRLRLWLRRRCFPCLHTRMVRDGLLWEI